MRQFADGAGLRVPQVSPHKRRCGKLRPGRFRFSSQIVSDVAHSATARARLKAELLTLPRPVAPRTVGRLTRYSEEDAKPTPFISRFRRSLLRVVLCANPQVSLAPAC